MKGHGRCTCRPPQEDPAEPPTAPLDPPAESQIDFSIDWPGPDVYMVVGRTNALYGYVDDMSMVSVQATSECGDRSLCAPGRHARQRGRIRCADQHQQRTLVPAAHATGGWSICVERDCHGNDGDTVTRTANFNVQGAVRFRRPTHRLIRLTMHRSIRLQILRWTCRWILLTHHGYADGSPYATGAPPTEEVTYGFGL